MFAMEPTTLLGLLLTRTFAVSGTLDPIERYYASMFASYFDWLDSQPSCAAVKAIAKGTCTAPRKLLRFYRDGGHPRCPKKLEEDLSTFLDNCFYSAAHRTALHTSLEVFMRALPAEDSADILANAEDLAQLWGYLTWYALCADQYE